jgi:hypothetical protein
MALGGAAGDADLRHLALIGAKKNPPSESTAFARRAIGDPMSTLILGRSPHTVKSVSDREASATDKQSAQRKPVWQEYPAFDRRAFPAVTSHRMPADS